MLRTALRTLYDRTPAPAIRRLVADRRRPPAPCPYGPATPHYDAGRGLFVFRGTDHAIGRQFAEAIPLDLEPARACLDGLPAAACKAVETALDTVIGILKAKVPHVAGMMEGAADASSGYRLRDVVLADCSTVLLDWRLLASCGAVAFRDGTGIVLGQNLDLGRTNATSVACIRPDHTAARVQHLNPGHLWFTTGVNECGFAYGGASVNVERTFSPPEESFPDVLLGSLLLARATSADHAAELLREATPFGPCHAGTSLILADVGGAIVSAEVHGDAVRVARRDGTAIATNHFNSADGDGFNRRSDPLARHLHRLSERRHGRAAAWLAEAPPTVPRLREFLRNRKGRGAWLRTGTLSDEGHTSASYIIDFGRWTFEHWSGVSNPAHRTLGLDALDRITD